VLSDYKMPGRDGLDLLAEVARRWPGTARFLITGWAGDAAPAALAAARLRAVFPKPWDVEDLRAALRAALAEG
jgi:two-component system response regulator PhcR